MTMIEVNDYTLTGPSASRAVDAGLADGTWFKPAIDPGRLAELTKRSNARALADAALWLGLIFAAGCAAWIVRGSWLALPAFAVYGALSGGAGDARWHEFGHGTACRSERANNAIYGFSSFLLARGPTLWRWSHFRHHTDTLIVGRDAEIAFQRPTSGRQILLAFSGVPTGPKLIARTVRHAFGALDEEARQLVPPAEHGRVIAESRVFVGLWAAAVAATVATATPWPLLYVGGPTIYGMWLMVFFGITQHAGLQENRLDHRYSTRTVLMNPILRFLYLNMNYHIEHHQFPAVPYYRLPALHAEIASQLPPPSPSTVAAYRELLGAMAKQRVDPTWELPRSVPDVAGMPDRIVQPLWWKAKRHGDDTVELGAVELQPGQIRPVRIGDEPGRYLVANISGGDNGEDDQLVLARSRCTHGDADLGDGALLGCEIECPKHNGRFDLRDGTPTRRPVSKPIDVYPLHFQGGAWRTVTPVAVSDG